MGTKTVVIAAGGSGGHIYPALAIADRLKKTHPELLIFFVGTAVGLENKIIPPKGYPLLHIPIGRLNKNVNALERIKTLIQMPLAFFKAIWICLKLRPLFLIGVGGHASGPMILMGSLLGFRTFIWEPNAYPGMANRYLSKFVSGIFVIFDEAAERLGVGKAKKVGYPMRQAIESLGHLPIRDSTKEFHVLVYGGSQGAQGINTAVLEMVGNYQDRLQGVQILLQCGTRDYPRVKRWTEENQLTNSNVLKITEFIFDMEEKYKWADIVLARSGMGSVSEFAATGIPSLLVPLPTSADGHQQKNAEALEKKGAATMILQKDLTGEVLLKQILELKNSSEKRQKMSLAVHDFYQPDGAGFIASEIMSGVRP